MDHVLRTANIQRLGRGRPPSKGDRKGGAKEVGEKRRNYGVIATKTGGRVSKRKGQATVSNTVKRLATFEQNIVYWIRQQGRSLVTLI